MKGGHPAVSDLHLRPARLAEQAKIYRWLAGSDATAEMLGPPRFADAPVPTYEEFCMDYDAEAFGENGNFRLFVMVAAGEEIGAISYYIRDNIVELDLWIADRANWNKGWGSRALREVIRLIPDKQRTNLAIIRPSQRNPRAIAAYRKAGFMPFDPSLHSLPPWCLTEDLDYSDAVVLFQPI